METSPASGLQSSIEQLVDVTSDCVQGLLIASERAKQLLATIESFGDRSSSIHEATLNAASRFETQHIALTEQFRDASVNQKDELQVAIGELQQTLNEGARSSAAVLSSIEGHLSSFAAKLEHRLSEIVRSNAAVVSVLEGRLSETAEQQRQRLDEIERLLGEGLRSDAIKHNYISGALSTMQDSYNAQIKFASGMRRESRLLWMIVAVIVLIVAFVDHTFHA